VSTIDHQFIEFVVKSLVSKPDAVKVERTIDEKGVLLELTVDPEDLGRVIGKRGATAQSIRTLLRALGTKNDARYNLKIVDNGEPKPRSERPERTDKQEPKAEDKKEDKPEEKQDEKKFGDLDEKSDFASTESPAEETQQDDTDTEDQADSDSYAKTRRELADLDDLDV
jgi:hypothetical protein